MDKSHTIGNVLPQIESPSVIIDSFPVTRMIILVCKNAVRFRAAAGGTMLEMFISGMRATQFRYHTSASDDCGLLMSR